MGIASYDLDADGYPEYFLTSMADNKLQSLAAAPAAGPAKPSYADIAFAKGVTAHRPYMGDDLRPSTGWHTQFEDVNNDGLADLFIAKGNVDAMPDFAIKDPNNLLLQGADGKFVEVGDKAGVASVAVARGAALTDFNLDGLVDLVVVNRREKAQIWRNTSEDAGGWIEVKLQQTGAQPRCRRRLDRGALRWHCGDAPRDHGRRRTRRRAARRLAFRAWRRDEGRNQGAMARRHRRRLAGCRAERALPCRARQAGAEAAGRKMKAHATFPTWGGAPAPGAKISWST